MDMIPDKNAYAVWLHLKGKYKPTKKKAYAELKKLEQKSEVHVFYDQKRQIKQAEQYLQM